MLFSQAKHKKTAGGNRQPFSALILTNTLKADSLVPSHLLNSHRKEHNLHCIQTNCSEAIGGQQIVFGKYASAASTQTFQNTQTVFIYSCLFTS